MDETRGGEVLECPRCRYKAARDSGWSMNPRQGYLVCPTCWHRGYDIIPGTVAEIAAKRAAEGGGT